FLRKNDRPQAYHNKNMATNSRHLLHDNSPDVDYADVLIMLANFGALFDKRPVCKRLMEHTFKTGDSAPIRCRLRPIDAHKRPIIYSCIEDLLQQNLIQPSFSQWFCAPVLVAKKSGVYQLAMDHRPLNAKIQVPVNPMPRTDWVLAEFGRTQWFTSFNLSQGFLRIPVRHEDIPKTAFICQQG
ncbi:polyprotein of retroviral origin, putative, partial [Ixodes scapularis]